MSNATRQLTAAQKARKNELKRIARAARKAQAAVETTPVAATKIELPMVPATISLDVVTAPVVEAPLPVVSAPEVTGVVVTAHVNGLPFTAKRPGVVGKILEALKSASPDAPVTKAQILDRLVAYFPERDSAKMKATVAGMVTWIRTEGKGVVQSNERGYWMAN